MTTSANPDSQATGTVCTPQSFVKGLYLLAKSFLKEAAAPLGAAGLLTSLFCILSIPAVNNYNPTVNDFAWASVVTFILGLACGLLSWFKKPYRDELGLATLFMFMFHMLAVMLTTAPVPGVFNGNNWWNAAPLLLKAAVLPMYVTVMLVQFALAAGILGLAVWGLYNLPKATRAAGRYICQTGQGK